MHCIFPWDRLQRLGRREERELLSARSLNDANEASCGAANKKRCASSPTDGVQHSLFVLLLLRYMHV